MPRSPKPPTPFAWDKFSLYELCAQNPPRDARLLRAIHSGVAGRSAPASSPSLTLAEDFCGTAALSRAWCAISPHFRAIATDIHAPTLARAKQLSLAHDRLKLTRADVMHIRDKADLIAVLNFSIGELHDRPTLIKYFRHAHSRLRPNGCLICDLYGGADAFETGMIDQQVKPPKGHPRSRDRITYSWEQRSADPLTARVMNAMHFEVRSGSAKPHTLIDAFVYRWRLWSIPELRDAMTEAGFRSTQVYSRMADATDADGNLYTQPVADPSELGDSFNVFVVGRR